MRFVFFKFFIGYFYPLPQLYSSLCNFRQKLKLAQEEFLNLNKAIYRSSLNKNYYL